MDTTATWLALLQQEPALLYGITILLGLAVGSFLNVLILRLPKMMEAEWRAQCAELDPSAIDALESPARPVSLSHPPSSCPHCGHRIRAHENIPLLSYLLLRGRCSACQGAIGCRYPLIEALTALASVTVIAQFGLTGQGAVALFLTWGLIALAVIDFDTQLLPDSLTLPLLWLGLTLSLFEVFVDSQTAITGAAIGYLSLWTVFQFFRLLTGKEGMGYGDFKLLALFGAWLGWQALPQIILFSALAGAIFGVVLIALKRHQAQHPMPFGPFLVIAGWIALLWGHQINDAYLRFSGLGY